MSFLKINKSYALSIILLVMGLFSASQKTEKIRYFHAQTISLPADKIQTYVVDFKDSIGVDTLFQIRAKEGIPIAYFRKITSNVCFDNKCRLLDIILYWNITGRYLGFEIPKGEFLSKSDHEPFTADEYQRMSEILADSLSALRGFSYNELVPKSNPELAKVDAISSATAPNVLEYVVKGAVYTTYKLWHFVYGTTQDEVEKLTVKEVSPNLLLKILESPDLSDKVWALNHAGEYLSQDSRLRTAIFALIDNKDYNLAERAINAVNLKATASDTLQLLLVDKLKKSNYALKKLLLNKLKEASPLSLQVKKSLAQQLKSLNGELVGNVLDIFKKQNVNDVETCRIIAELLENDNTFISQKAYTFLKSLKIQDNVIEAKLVKYKTQYDLNRN